MTPTNPEPVEAPVVPPFGAAGTSYLLHDTFTDADDTALDGHTMDVGGGWTESAGDWDIQSNKCNPKTAAAENKCWAEASAADLTVSADMSLSANTNYPGVMVRFTDNDNNWFTLIGNTEDELRLYENNAGVLTIRANTAVTIAFSTDYAVQVVTAAQVITCTLDGGNEISYSSAALNETATKHGFRCYGDAALFDNFIAQ